MTETPPYPLLSTYSLLRMLCHAIGDWGVLSKVTVERLKNFLSYDVKYNYPSVIRSEIARAERMGLLKIENGIVSFTEEALARIKEYNITDGVNEKFWKFKEMEAKGMTTLAMTLKMQVEKEGFWWYPEEWKGKEIKIASTEPEAKKQKTITPTRKISPPKKLN